MHEISRSVDWIDDPCRVVRQLWNSVGSFSTTFFTNKHVPRKFMSKNVEDDLLVGAVRLRREINAVELCLHVILLIQTNVSLHICSSRQGGLESHLYM